MRSTTFEVLYAYVNFQILLLNLPHIVLILNIKGKAETGTIFEEPSADWCGDITHMTNLNKANATRYGTINAT